jgi:hypothetical protein
VLFIQFKVPFLCICFSVFRFFLGKPSFYLISLLVAKLRRYKGRVLVNRERRNIDTNCQYERESEIEAEGTVGSTTDDVI